jgi:hypothetical protein
MGDIYLLTPVQRQRRIENEIARQRAGLAKLHLEGIPDGPERRAKIRQYLAERERRSITSADFGREIEALIIRAQVAGVSVEEEISVLQGLMDALKATMS